LAVTDDASPQLAILKNRLLQLGDITNAKVTRIRTFAKFLDAVNFPGGNTTADPTAYFDDEVYYIDRKATENYIYIEYELSTAWDLQGINIPRRQIIQNVCLWRYRGEGCGYTGTAYFDEFDVAVATQNLDVCGKRFSSCSKRFAENTDKPFGGFPAVGLIS
jgi:lambda family phage minor tail protein L